MAKLGVVIILFVFLSCAGALPVVTTGLVSYYSFNGNANDGYGTSHGSPQNGAYLTSGYTGTAASAYAFDGIDDYIDCGSSPATQFSDNQSFSISLWMNVVANDNRKPVIDRYRYGIEVGPDESLYFWVRTYDAATWTSSAATYTTPLNAGSWYHVVAVYEDFGTTQNVKLYLNGYLIQSVSGPLSNTYPYTSLYIGKSNHIGGIYYQGSMDEVALYQRALGDAEVMQLYGVPEPSTIILFFIFGIFLFKMKMKNRGE